MNAQCSVGAEPIGLRKDLYRSVINGGRMMYQTALAGPFDKRQLKPSLLSNRKLLCKGVFSVQAATGTVFDAVYLTTAVTVGTGMICKSAGRR